MGKVKEKLCKHCNKSFIPTQPLQNTCSYSHFVKYQETKAKNKRKVEKLKKAVSVSVLKARLWKLFSEYIRRSESKENI